MQIEKLEAIIAGSIRGEEAAEILRGARQYVDDAEKIAQDTRRAISMAEVALIYGSEGRPQGRTAFSP